MSHDSHPDAAHSAPKPYARPLGILAGLLIWWTCVGGLVFTILLCTTDLRKQLFSSDN